MSGDERARRWENNPFFVLGLSPGCSRGELERAGQRLLGLLAVGNEAARRCRTPVGVVERDADRVRAAMAELRDPNRRIAYELEACSEPPSDEAAPPSNAQQGWDGALAALGWRAPWKT